MIYCDIPFIFIHCGCSIEDTSGRLLPLMFIPTIERQNSTHIENWICNYNLMYLILELVWVSIVTRLWAGQYIDQVMSWSDRAGVQLPIAAVSILTVGPTQPPIQWVPGVLSPEVKHPCVKITTHFHPWPRLRIGGSVTSLPHTH
jgi:hypothetical protein